MYGDITRDTFDRRKHYARVLHQQGRVGLDADPNEQTAILLHYLRSLARDLVGPAWGPKEHLGFEITAGAGGDFNIGVGHYYVDGILCECDEPCTYRTQPHYPWRAPGPGEQDPTGLPCLFYLDVWERPVTYIGDDRIREAALNGPDTATRTQVVWQVRTRQLEAGTKCADMKPAWKDQEGLLKQTSLRGQLSASVADGETSTDPCTISPKSAYRGLENQLYRVEIHRPGKEGVATFMYSRDNGSVCFPLISLAGGEAEVESLGRDDRHRLRIGDWVEVVYDEVVLRGEPTALAQVIQLDESAGRVTLAPPDGTALPVYPMRDPMTPPGDAVHHPFLRRWDQRERQRGKGSLPKWAADDGALVLMEGVPLPLEDGVLVTFSKPAPADPAHHYQSGDHWLIPARVATADVEWPRTEKGVAIPQAPHGIKHHYAPLAVLPLAPAGLESCRTPV
jgi:hypothetical protein